TFAEDITATDKSFANLGHLQNLHYLDLNSTDISDAVIEEINKLPLLDNLRIGGTNITANAVIQLKLLKKLKTLGIKFIDNPSLILGELRNSEIIEELECGAASLNEHDIETLTTMKNLVSIDLYKASAFNNTSLKKLTKLKRLKFLDLRQTAVTAESFPIFAKFEKFESLKIDDALWNLSEITLFRKMYPKIRLQVDEIKSSRR
ncbi:MAG: hypothetical protein IAF58_02040, partial [Leptolyngbya sp.]|nr:hypothetical protein [Candidatus Melainabacteria bacterium]